MNMMNPLYMRVIEDLFISDRKQMFNIILHYYTWWVNHLVSVHLMLYIPIYTHFWLYIYHAIYVEG